MLSFALIWGYFDCQTRSVTAITLDDDGDKIVVIHVPKNNPPLEIVKLVTYWGLYGMQSWVLLQLLSCVNFVAWLATAQCFYWHSRQHIWGFMHSHNWIYCFSITYRYISSKANTKNALRDFIASMYKNWFNWINFYTSKLSNLSKLLPRI